MSDYLTPKQIALAWGLEVGSVLRWCRSGKLRAVQLGGFRGPWRVPVAAWEEFCQVSEPGPPVERKPRLSDKVPGRSRQDAADRILDAAGI